jgi:hypothetical protein
MLTAAQRNFVRRGPNDDTIAHRVLIIDRNRSKVDPNRLHGLIAE